MLDREAVMARCAVLPGAVAERPFGPGVEVFKVGGKCFAFVSTGREPARVSLKFEPEMVEALRVTYAAVQPAPYLHRRHWNAVTLDGSVPDEELAAWIEDSHALVAAGLPRATRRSLGIG